MLTIYGVPISVHTRKAIVAAHLKEIEHKFEPVIPFDPPSGWDELSPTGLIPAAVDGDLRMADSSVICRYIEMTEPAPPIYPAEKKDLLHALFLESYGGTLFARLIHPLFHQKIIGPKVFGRQTDQAEVGKLMGETRSKLFSYLESQTGDGYLAGDALTIGDITIASNLINYRYMGLQIEDGRYPKLSRYLKRIVRLDPFRIALTAEAPFAEKMGLDPSYLD
jgi:glutathione S-transferase